MHSKPQEETPPPSRPATLTSSLTDEKKMDVDTNLIQLDTYFFFFLNFYCWDLVLSLRYYSGSITTKLLNI